jgi:transposase InsO family protein
VVIHRGAPRSITVDNGSEFASRVMDAWAYRHGIQLDVIRPGKPVENGIIESFHGRLRDECLNVEVFVTLEDVREKLWRWPQDYHRVRPIVYWRIERLRCWLPSGSRRPRRLTRTPLHYWRPSRELC